MTVPESERMEMVSLWVNPEDLGTLRDALLSPLENVEPDHLGDELRTILHRLLGQVEFHMESRQFLKERDM